VEPRGWRRWPPRACHARRVEGGIFRRFSSAESIKKNDTGGALKASGSLFGLVLRRRAIIGAPFNFKGFFHGQYLSTVTQTLATQV
jgi:hypothetical protein